MIEQTFYTWRPKWEFTTELESAFRKFNDLRAQNCKMEEVDTVEPEEAEDETSSIDGDADFPNGDDDISQSSGAEAEDDVRNTFV